MKNIGNFINEALSYHYNGLTTLHFESVAAAFLYKFELAGQISDGKYENSRPSNHWIWVTNTKIVVDGSSFYSETDERGERPYYFRHRLKNYNLREWPGYITSEKDSWAERVLAYGKLGATLESKEPFINNTINDDWFDNVDRLAEEWYDAVKNNIEFKDIEYKAYIKQYIDKIDSNINNEKVYKKFCETEYTINDLKNDLRSMAETVNTPESEK
jgi:hypothetical protein